MFQCDSLFGFALSSRDITIAKNPNFSKTTHKMEENAETRDLANEVYDLIRVIKDPEKPQTLEELNVVQEDGVCVTPMDKNDSFLIKVEFVPTVPHCSLATLIGLSLRIKLERNLLQKFKLDISIKKGTHSTESEINKQINDKERIAAAMENPNLLALVNSCLEESSY